MAMSNQTQQNTLAFILCVTSFVLGGVVSAMFLGRQSAEPVAYEYAIEKSIYFRNDNGKERLAKIAERGGIIQNPCFYNYRVMTRNDRQFPESYILVRYPRKRK